MIMNNLKKVKQRLEFKMGNFFQILIYDEKYE